MWQSHLIHTGCHMSLLSFVGSLIIHDLTWKVLYLSIPSTFAFIINTMHSVGEKSSACQTLCHATVQVYKLHWYSIMSFDRVTSLGLTVAFKWLHIKTKMTLSQVLEALVSNDFRGPKSYSLLDCAVSAVPVSVSLLFYELVSGSVLGYYLTSSKTRVPTTASPGCITSPRTEIPPWSFLFPSSHCQERFHGSFKF